MIASIAAPLACRSARIAGMATLTIKASATARNCAAETVAKAYQRREVCVSILGTPLMMVPRMAAPAAPIDYVTGNHVRPPPRRNSVVVALSVLRHLEQEPGAPFGLVDPDLEQAGAGDVVVLIAGVVHGAHDGHQLAVVLAQLGEHVLRRHVGGV